MASPQYNHLRHETSPYLLQHARNPVDWHPWSAETLQLARAQDKPILLSIGYSACHWCHVMAHESFEDEAVAAVMNEHFVNIKVDREERPDLDQIYQNAHYVLTRRSGGWPLTMFLAPDGTPFYGGTYFPKLARHGLPGFPHLVQQLAKAYHERRREVLTQGQEVAAALASLQPPSGAQDAALDAACLETATRELAQTFDPVHGGFGRAPKFLHPTELDLLLRLAQAQQNEPTRHVALFTLRQMAKGGLYDQLGGGFCRYSVDERWDIPHFEKMLYDNALLLGVYCDAWLTSGETLFCATVEQTTGWVMREMQSPAGGYYASLDADSEHEEGKFYLWQRDEVRALLGADDYAVAAPYYGLDRAPNFEQHAWNLHVSESSGALAQQLRVSPEQLAVRLVAIRATLLRARAQRVRPGRDEKILGAWNGLMIGAMAKAARVWGRADWLHSAQRALDFVRETLWREGTLLATHKDGRSHLNAYLDDHAFLLHATLELLQTEYRPVDLRFATQLAEALLARFEDQVKGGFFFTSHDHEALIQRTMIGPDNATPSGNGVAAQGLLRLGALTGEQRYLDAAARCVRAFAPSLQESPSHHSSLCTALDELLHPVSLLVLCGAPDDTAAWRAAVSTTYRPNLIVVALTGGEPDLPPPLARPRPACTTAWLCHGTQCLPPITNKGDILLYLDGKHGLVA